VGFEVVTIVVTVEPPAFIDGVFAVDLPLGFEALNDCRHDREEALFEYPANTVGDVEHDTEAVSDRGRVGVSGKVVRVDSVQITKRCYFVSHFFTDFDELATFVWG